MFKTFILALILFLYSQIIYATDPCTSITDIQCNIAITFTSNGIGDAAYPNGMNGQGCSAGSAQGGQESIYRLVVPTTGTYQINTLNILNSAFVDYYFKKNMAICSNTGWTCLARNSNNQIGLGAIDAVAGDTLLLLLNAESTGTTTQSFIIKCASVVCDSIQNILCNTAVTFNSFGFGSNAYPNGLNGQGCSSGNLQGGQETIYRLVVPTTGTYQINTLNILNSAFVDYYFKKNMAVCSNIGWTCLARNSSNQIGLGAIDAVAGDTLLLLLNAESTGTTSQSFIIKCASVICDSIQNILCNTAVTFNSFGFGSNAYPNGLNGQGCSSGNLQGGQETIYRIVAPISGTYQIISLNVSNSAFVDYYYKKNLVTCSNTGWTCLRRNAQNNVGIGPIDANAGDTILLLLNAESTSLTSQSFQMKCGVNTIEKDTTICANSNIQLSATLQGTEYQWQVNTGNGFVNINDNANYSGSITSALSLSNIPSSFYGYRYRCHIGNIVDSFSYKIRIGTHWLGNTNTAWEVPSNWNCGLVPDIFTDVYIDSGRLNYPIVNSDAVCHKLFSSISTTVIVSIGKSLVITGTNQ